MPQPCAGAGLPKPYLSLQSAASRLNASAKDLVAFANLLWTEFRFDKAISFFHRAAAREPTNPFPPLLAAKRLFSIARFGESAQFLRAALERAPDNSSIRRMLAEVLERNGQHAEAETLAREALGENPSDTRTARALARIVRSGGRIHEAAELLRTHLRDYPGGEAWRINQELAICLDRLGEYGEAMSALLKAKEELGAGARPLLEEWRRRMTRRVEFAQRLDQSTLRRWRERASALHQKNPVAVLAGHPRSGTTLLEQMLRRHSAIVTTDETGILRRQFVEPIVMDPSSSSDAFVEVDGFSAEQLEVGRDFYFRATAEHVGTPLGDQLVIEKDPLATWDLGLILRLLPECQVIFPLRDPRDVCLSYFFTLLPLNPDSAPASDLGTTCEAARFTLRLWKHWRRVIPQSWEEVRYEQLVRDPRGELMRLMKLLGLRFEEQMLAPAAEPQRRGVRTPTYAEVTQPLYTHSIGRWQNYARWLEPHLPSFTPWLNEFGYE